MLDERSALRAAWLEGVERYNAGLFWEAHESWERGWKDLGEPERTWVQAWIQVAGAHHLRLRGAREVPARALIESARSKLALSGPAMRLIRPRLEIEGWDELAPGRARLELT